MKKTRRFWLSALFLLALAACGKRSDTLFTKLEKGSTGINFRNILEESAELNVLNYLYFYNGGGVAVGDIDNDGLQDLFFAGNMAKNRLFRNKGDFEFEDITATSHVSEKQGWCLGATMVDINADGWLDIYVCRSADVRPAMRRNLLFVNNKDRTFTERAAEYGLDDPGYSTHAAFFDMDRDGDLDMFLLNHSLTEYTGVKLEMAQYKQKKNPDFSSKLYRNDGGHFTNVTDSAGITNNVLSFGLGVGISDANADGWPDIYVCNDFNEQDYLFINNRNGTFTDRLPEHLDHTSLFSMGCDWTDINNDGRPDLATVDMLPEDNFTQKMHMGAENFNKFQNLFSNGFYYQYSRNMLHLNNGDGSFSEIGQLAGVSNTDWSWAVLGADFDLDGWKDLFVSNGYVKDYTDMDFLKYTMDQTLAARQSGKEGESVQWLKEMKGSKLSNYLFKNRGDLSFENVAQKWGLGGESWAYGAAYADLDNDGDLDLVTSNINEYAGVYRNEASEKSNHNWLKIKLSAEKPNAFGIGSKVRVFAGGRVFFQEMMPSRGYASSVDYNLVFGLGDAAKVDSILVEWPDGSRQKLGETAAKQNLEIKQNAPAPTSPEPVAAAKSLFSMLTDALDFVHRENPEAIDFKTQTLLPHFFSRQGPCLAKADVNADGIEDLFAGGAKNQEGSLFLGSKNGSFLAKPSAVFAPDKGCEDVGAAFFDADGDRDFDLYVVSGGYEFEPNSPALQDRLYLNDGRGNFSKSTGALPAETVSGSCVRPADFDADGDMDLFVGGRVVPGRWPESPESQLLVNDGRGVFSNQTAALAPALARVGMVTDAAWAELNGDGSPELLVVGEWMQPRFFKNDRGKLADATAQFLAGKNGGWWHCIAPDDLDGDGDTDFVLGNLGLNSQIRADENRPASLDFSDFDGNGTLDPIFSYFIGNQSFPAAFRDDLAEQLPSIKKKFNDYKSYANATLTDIFSKEQLGKAQHLEATELRSGWLDNQGGRFVFRALPLEAQFAPVHAALLLDADADGKKDLLLAGNNRSVRIRYGRYDANHGQLFLGDGRGGFRYLPQPESGLNLRGDVRSLLLWKGNGFERVVFGLNDGRAVVAN